MGFPQIFTRPPILLQAYPARYGGFGHFFYKFDFLVRSILIIALSDLMSTKILSSSIFFYEYRPHLQYKAEEEPRQFFSLGVGRFRIANFIYEGRRDARLRNDESNAFILLQRRRRELREHHESKDDTHTHKAQPLTSPSLSLSLSLFLSFFLSFSFSLVANLTPFLSTVARATTRRVTILFVVNSRITPWFLQKGRTWRTHPYPSGSTTSTASPGSTPSCPVYSPRRCRSP